jgi:hypothetical protein
MNCTTVQRRLLAQGETGDPGATDDPGENAGRSEAIQEHLENCPHCQEWQRRVTQIDRHIPLLPVPRSAARASFVQQFRAETTVWDRARYRLRNLQRWQLTAGALAASLALVFMVWLLAPNDPAPVVHPKSSTPDKLLATLMQPNLKLAVATSPKVQVQTLAELAEDLRTYSGPLHLYGSSKEGKESLRDLSEWYGLVVRMEVTCSVKLPAEEVRPVLEPIVLQLATATDDAERLASQTHNISADHPLFTIGNAARNGKDHLERILKQQGAAAPLPRRDPLLLHPGSRPEQHCSRASFPLPLALLAAAPAVQAQTPSPAVIAADQAMGFQRNRKLIAALVENCLHLTQLTESVQRASSCMGMADRLAEELDRAAAEQDLVRATDLAKALKDLLIEGIAFNLTTAGAEIPAGAVRETQMLQIGDHVHRITSQLEEKLQGLPKDSPKELQERWQRVRKQIADGRTEVHKALKGRGTY